MTTRKGRLARWALVIAGGAGLGLGLHGMLPRPVFGRDTAALAEFQSLVGCYGQRLGEFSKAAGDFSVAKLEGPKQIEQSIAPLKVAVINQNASYTALSRSHFALIADVAGQGGRARDVREVSRQLQRVDEFQWKELRPKENGLLGDIISVSQDIFDADIIARIREQQRSGWLDLREMLALESRKFAAISSKPCEPTRR